MSLQLTVQELLRRVDAPRIIAQAILRDDLTRYGQEESSWLEVYSVLYQDLTTVLLDPEQEDPMMLWVWPEDETPEALDVSGMDLAPGKRDGTKYAMEYTQPEVYAGMLVPWEYLRRYPVELIASEVLREYGWHGADRKGAAPLVLYRKAEACLQEWRFCQTLCAGDPEVLRQEKIAFREAVSPEYGRTEAVLEAAGMDFSLYHQFMKEPDKVRQTDGQREDLPRIRHNVSILRALGYRDEDIARLYYEKPSFLAHPCYEFRKLLNRRGAEMTRYLLQRYPERLEEVLASGSSPEELRCSPLQCAPGREVFRYAYEHDLTVWLSELDGNRKGLYRILSLAGDRNGGKLWCEEYDDHENAPLRCIDWQEISSVCIGGRAGKPVAQEKRIQAARLAEEAVGGRYYLGEEGRRK